VASTAVLLFLSSCSTAVIHALIPDHWLPLVLMSRAQTWSERRTLAMVGITGAVHALVSLLVGACVILAGSSSARGLAERLGASLEWLAGLLLVAFGIVYGFWAHRRESLAHAGIGEHGRPPQAPLHAHGHLLSRWAKGSLSGGALVAIIGLSPCILLQPILFAAAAEGAAAAAAAAAGFALCTIGTMLCVAYVATQGMRRIELRFFTRYGDLISGLVIAGIGVAVLIGER
jgi:threonine/homoserine/homoserine lactone efflux protein